MLKIKEIYNRHYAYFFTFFGKIYSTPITGLPSGYFQTSPLAVTPLTAALFLMGFMPNIAQAKQVTASGTTETAPDIVDTGILNGKLGYGLHALNSGVINSNSPLIVQTKGQSANPVHAESGGQINIFDGSYVTGTGAGAYGFYAKGNNSTITAINTDVLVTGTNSHALRAENNSTITLSGGSITGTSRGAFSFDGGMVSATDVAITATGANSSVGIESNAKGQIMLTGGSVMTTGTGVRNHGLYVIDTSRSGSVALTATGTTIQTAGMNSIGAYINIGKMVLNDVKILTTGAGSDGAMVDGINDLTAETSTLTINGGFVKTESATGSAYGLASYTGAVINSNEVDITTLGTSSYGAVAEFGGVISINGGSVSTSGKSASGLFAVGLGGKSKAPSQINGINTKVLTSGDNAHGAVVRSVANLNLVDTDISTSGVGAAGLYSTTYQTPGVSTATLTNSSLTSAQAAGIRILGMPTATTQLDVSLLQGSTVTGHPNAIEVFSNGMTATLNLTADHSTLNGGAVLDTGSTSDITLKHGSLWNMTAPVAVSNLALDNASLRYGSADLSVTTTNPIELLDGGGTIDSNGFNSTLETSIQGLGGLTKIGAGELTFSGINTYRGSTTVSAGTLTASATDIFSPYSDVIVQAPGTLEMRGFNQTVPNLSNAGTVSLSGDPGTVLTVSGVYTSNGGNLLLKSTLVDDSSVSDKLVAGKIAMGTGATRVFISNVNGLGALTTGNGIEVVHVNDPNASPADVFVLGGRVAAGAYEYSLVQNGIAAPDGNWYLRSTLVPDPTPETPDPIPEVPDPTPETPDPIPEVPDPTPETPDPIPEVPDPTPEIPDPGPETLSPRPALPKYRNEVPLAMAVPVLANRFGLTMLGTYRDRNGNDYSATDHPAGQNLSWGRAFAEKGGAGKSGYHEFTEQGSSYDYHTEGFQVGQHLYGAQNESGTRDVAGIYLGVGSLSGDVNAVLGGRAGSVSMTGTTLGGYWTRKGASNWYVDGVLQGTIYNNVETRSIEGEKLNSKGHSVSASIEGGYPIVLGHDWALEPQAQLIYQYTSMDSAHDSMGKIKFEDMNTGYARLGTRLTKQLNSQNREQGTVSARVNVWQQIGSDSRTTVSTLQGSHPVTLSTNLGSTWMQVGIGASGQISENVKAFTGVDYNQTMGNASGHSIGGHVGIQIHW